jgi:hypothetical protein
VMEAYAMCSFPCVAGGYPYPYFKLSLRGALVWQSINAFSAEKGEPLVLSRLTGFLDIHLRNSHP